MNKKLKNTLLATLCCGLLATAGAGVLTGFNASADSVRVTPTGANTNTLTEAINDADLDTFQVYGASTGKKALLGFRFLATIEESDLALIPNTAEFGMVIIPKHLLGEGELTVDTANALVAPALVDTAATEVPDGGLGYYITLMGETLEKAFPESLYDTVLTARNEELSGLHFLVCISNGYLGGSVIQDLALYRRDLKRLFAEESASAARQKQHHYQEAYRTHPTDNSFHKSILL